MSPPQPPVCKGIYHFREHSFDLGANSSSSEIEWFRTDCEIQGFNLSFEFQGQNQRVEFLFYNGAELVDSYGFELEAGCAVARHMTTPLPFSSIRIRVHNLNGTNQTTKIKMIY
jgi:hypothetical protein